jgi:DNA-binding NarL/FixJ family response regulator
MKKILTYVKGGLAYSWLNDIAKDLSSFYDFSFHNSLESLKNEIEFIQLKSNPKKIYIIIDVEDISYALYTKSYFSDYSNIEFIGVGNNKDINEQIELISNNICSYIVVGNNSIELVKALKSIENGKYYLCDETKDYLLAYYFNKHKSNNKFNATNKLYKLNNEIETGKDIEALTEKEKKVCLLLTKGLTYKEISTLLGVTVFAINQNTKSIYKKLKVRSRAELSFKMFA